MKYLHGSRVRAGRYPRLLCIVLLLVSVGLTYAWQSCRLFRGHSDTELQIQSSASEAINSNIEYSAKVVFLGDTMLGRVVGPAILRGEDPFENVRSVLDTYDMRIANIESVIADPSIATTPAKKRYTFNAPLGVLDSLKSVPIDVNVLANNHTGDFGRSAMLDMLSNFDNAGLVHVGLGADIDEAFKPLLIDLELSSVDAGDVPSISARLAIIAFNDFENAFSDAGPSLPGSAFFDKSRLRTSIDSAKRDGADFVFVVPHWGTEFVLGKHNDRQQELGRWLIDAGADAVIGGHPHVIQSTEIYNGKPIVYSLGNFVFSGMESIANTGRGQMFGLSISTKAVVAGSEVVETSNLLLGELKYHFYNLDMNGYPVLE